MASTRPAPDDPADQSPFAKLPAFAWDEMDASAAASAALRVGKAGKKSTWRHQEGRKAAVQGARAALSSKPGAWRALDRLPMSNSEREWIVGAMSGPMPRRQAKQLALSGELPWTLRMGPSWDAWSFDGADFQVAASRRLDVDYAMALTLAIRGARHSTLDSPTRIAMGEHLANPVDGAQAAREALGMAIQWIHAHAEFIQTEAFGTAHLRRIDQLLDLGCPAPERAAFFHALSSAKQIQLEQNESRERAKRWAEAARCAILSESADILGALLPAAALAKVDLSHAAFSYDTGRGWSPFEDTLLEMAFEAKSGACADLLASLPGSSKAYFDDQGRLTGRSPFTKAKPAIESGGDAWSERLASISLLLAEDLLARGIEREACAAAVESCAARMVSKNGRGKATRGGSNLERAIMKQSAALSQWRSQAEPRLEACAAPKRASRRI